METDILVRTTTTDGSDLRYMTTDRAADAAVAEREHMAATSDENPFQNPPINDRSTGIQFFCVTTLYTGREANAWQLSFMRQKVIVITD